MIISMGQFMALFGWPNGIGHGPFLPENARGILVALARHVAAESVVEFGVQNGSTAKCIMDAVKSVKRYVGVDLPAGERPVLGLQEREMPSIPGEMALGISGFNVLLQDSKTIKAEQLPRADVVFIDGGHDAKTVDSDTKLAFAIVKAGGVIVWDDYFGGSEFGVQGVIDGLNSREDRCVLVDGTRIVFRLV